MTEGKKPVPNLLDARILVVEDEYFLAEDLARTLKGRGARVIGPVASLGEAQALVAENPPDCAILDINLRGDMAFPLADRLEAAGIPFIVASGYDGGAIPERFIHAPRLEKPFTSEDVIAAIPNLLGGRRQPPKK